MDDTPEISGDDPGEDPVFGRITLVIPHELAGQRLDRALGQILPEGAGLSRSRLASLIADGQLRTENGETVAGAARKVKPGETYLLDIPAPVAAEPEPEAIPLEIVHEDADLLIVNKPAGMVVHPAPGAETGTLVNALLHHCGDTLSGIGGVRRPGIVHRIDRNTSGLLVVAKSEPAHHGLAALFARHDIERAYLAICHGVPSRTDPRLAGLPGVSFEPQGWVRIETMIDRHPSDRKRMAVSRDRGRNAVTRLRAIEAFGSHASLLECRLETGRTHQIRVHATHAGHTLFGDPVYGGNRRLSPKLPPELLETVSRFNRQALHAARLGFVHPVTGEALAFEAALPEDMAKLLDAFRRNPGEET